MRVTQGTDWFARVFGGDSSVGDTGTAGTPTAPTATTLTDTTKTWTTNQWVGHIVADGAVYGSVISNTATVLTVDRWYVPATPGGTAGATPALASTYTILPGNAPMWWTSLSNDAGAPAAGDTALTGEQTTNGFSRKLATYAHTNGQSTFTLTASWTSTQSSGTTTMHKEGFFWAQNGSNLIYETVLSPGDAILGNGDQITSTETITMS